MDNPTDLSLYKPNPSVAAAFDVDESMSDADLTFDAFKKLVLARKTQDLVFLSIGKMLKIFRDRKLYKHLSFDNFGQFLGSEELSFSREKAYLYIRSYELYVEKLQLNPDEIGKMGVVRLQRMAPIIKDMSNEDAIKEIEEMDGKRYGDFIRTVEEKTNKSGKPTIYWSEEKAKWVINYYEDTTSLVSLGQFGEK